MAHIEAHLETLTRRLSEAAERENRLRRMIAECRKHLETAVCTEGCDKGIILLSDDGPTHPEPAPCPSCKGEADPTCRTCAGTGTITVQVYEHENFSPLGDALIAAWEALCKSAN